MFSKSAEPSKGSLNSSANDINQKATKMSILQFFQMCIGFRKARNKVHVILKRHQFLFQKEMPDL